MHHYRPPPPPTRAKLAKTPNAYVLFRAAYGRTQPPTYPRMELSRLSEESSKAWKALSDEEKAVWYNKADELRVERERKMLLSEGGGGGGGLADGAGAGGIAVGGGGGGGAGVLAMQLDSELVPEQETEEMIRERIRNSEKRQEKRELRKQKEKESSTTKKSRVKAASAQPLYASGSSPPSYPLPPPPPTTPYAHWVYAPYYYHPHYGPVLYMMPAGLDHPQAQSLVPPHPPAAVPTLPESTTDGYTGLNLSVSSIEALLAQFAAEVGSANDLAGSESTGMDEDTPSRMPDNDDLLAYIDFDAMEDNMPLADNESEMLVDEQQGKSDQLMLVLDERERGDPRMKRHTWPLQADLCVDPSLLK